MRKFLITGGAGFIGGHLAEALLKRGDQVRILDNFATGKRETAANLKGDLEVIEGDLRDLAIVKSSVRGVDGVFHQGALASVPRSIRDPLLTNETNVAGTLNALMAARDGGVRRFVMASSSSIYGDSPTLPKVESMPLNPLSPYALQKAAGEVYARMFFSLYGFETIALRYFNIYGPRQDPKSEYAAVVPKFITHILRDEQPKIFGDGTQSRDFTYVENAVAANLAAMDAPVSACGSFYNIGCGTRFSLNELISEINGVFGKSISPIYETGRVGEVKHSLADIEAARRNLGYDPKVSFQEGVRRTVDWFRTQEKP